MSEEGVFEHGDGLDGRMRAKTLAGIRAEGGGTGIGPDVGSPPTMAPELDIVDVRRSSFLEEREELVRAPVQAAHPGIR